MHGKDLSTIKRQRKAINPDPTNESSAWISLRAGGCSPGLREPRNSAGQPQPHGIPPATPAVHHSRDHNVTGDPVMSGPTCEIRSGHCNHNKHLLTLSPLSGRAGRGREGGKELQFLVLLQSKSFVTYF